MEKRKASLCLSILFIAVVLVAYVNMEVLAASGKLYIAVSSSSLDVGKTVAVTVSAVGENDEKVTASMKLSYNTEVFSFVSCGEDSYSGGEGGSVSVTAETFSVTLKAKAEGNGAISVSGSNGYVTDTSEALASVTAAGTTIRIGSSSDNLNEGNSTGNASDSNVANKSPDNSLSSIKLSPGTLSPAFRYSTTEYTASVGSDVEEISIEAKPSHSKAVVESITGNTNLKAGQNTIYIKVKAENGVVATYTVRVTKGAAATPSQDNQEDPDAQGTTSPNEPGTDVPLQQPEQGQIKIGGVAYEVTGEFSEEEIPKDFSAATIVYQGQEVKAAKYDAGNLTLLYLTSQDENAKKGFYVYQEEENLFQPFLKLAIGESYIIVLSPPPSTAVPEGYEKTELTIVDASVASIAFVAGYQYTLEDTIQSDIAQADVRDFYLLYAMNSDGAEALYRYDSTQQTVQRYVETVSETFIPQEEDDSEALLNAQKARLELDEKYKNEKAFARKCLAISIFAIVLLIIVTINFIVYRIRNSGVVDVFSDDEQPKKKVDFKQVGHQDLEVAEVYDEEIKPSVQKPQEQKPKTPLQGTKELPSKELIKEIAKEPKKKDMPTVPDEAPMQSAKPKEEDFDLEVMDLNDLDL
ncbi:cadherin-like beta sandwich domain-containing protein [Lachnospiraceae bacterium ZAX-1]